MRAGEYGVQLQIDAEFSLAGATAMKLYIEAPDDSVTSKTLTPPGSGQTVTYTTLAADFPNAGRYLLMLEADFGGTKRLRSRPRPFQVDDAYDYQAPES